MIHPIPSQSYRLLEETNHYLVEKLAPLSHQPSCERLKYNLIALCAYPLIALLSLIEIIAQAALSLIRLTLCCETDLSALIKTCKVILLAGALLYEMPQRAVHPLLATIHFDYLGV